jgi:hypothetical protein
MRDFQQTYIKDLSPNCQEGQYNKKQFLFHHPFCQAFKRIQR